MHKGRPNLALDEDQLVSLDPRDLEDLRRLVAKLDPATRQGFVRSSSDLAVRADNESDSLVKRARVILANRRRRSAIFGAQMFSEPAWEILLTLYADQQAQRHTQSGVIDASGTSKTTALRWIDYLLERDFIRREDHPTDKRLKFLALSENGLNLLEMYLSETVRG